jgi:hypothetical protein
MPKIDKNSRTLLLFVLVAILSAVIYYQSTKCYNIDGNHAAANMDTYIYMQYAKSIALGHPYQFNIGTPPTTGCTSHLYPFILSIFYRAGAQGQALVECAFWLNVLFFVLSVVLLWFILQKLEPKGRLYITALFVLSGYNMMTFVISSDMGLFTMLTFTLWNSFLYRRYRTATGVLFILPFARPEGIFISFVFIILSLWKHVKDKGTDKKAAAMIAAGGIAGSGGMLLLNILLTGMPALDSTLHKSYLNQFDLVTALTFTLNDITNFWKTLLWGTDRSFRQFFFIPIVSGAVILFGFFQTFKVQGTDKTSRFVELWWLGCLCAITLMVATSNQIGLHYDRYFFWLLPLLIIYMIRGIYSLPLNSTFRNGLFATVLLFQVVTYPFFLRRYMIGSGMTTVTVQKCRKAKEMYPENTTVAVMGGSGIQYLNPSWNVVNIGGVTVPWFRKTGNNMARVIKTCQHAPLLHFEKTISLPGANFTPEHLAADSTIVEVPSPFKSVVKTYSIDWSLMTCGDLPLTDTIDGACIAALRLVDHFDAAWPEDEKRCGLEVRSRFPYTVEYPVLTTGDIRGRKLVDAVHPVTKGAFMTLATEPDKGHLLVLRTVVDEKVAYRGLDGTGQRRINTRSVDHLLLTIPGRYKIKIDMTSVRDTTEHYREHLVSIPPEMITGSTTEFGILGDHLLCDVWVYTKNYDNNRKSRSH